MTGDTLIIDIDNVKVDFIRFKYPFAFPFLQQDNITLLDLRDIAPMKIDAITARGRKKDFYDLFFLLRHFELDAMMQWYDAMFKKVTIFHIWKASPISKMPKQTPIPMSMTVQSHGHGSKKPSAMKSENCNLCDN